MFKIFRKQTGLEYALPTLDPHITSPGQDQSVIVRNEQAANDNDQATEIYFRARQIYSRGRRYRIRRTAGII